MTFATPLALLGLALVPAAAVAYWLLQRRRARYALRFTNLDLLANVAEGSPRWRRHVPPALLLAAIAALVVALARPELTVQVPNERSTVVLAVDTSGSMEATDVEPSRLAAAQDAAGTFLDVVPEELRVGLVAFSTEPAVLAPPTTEHGQVRSAVDALVAGGGTAIGDAIVRAVELAPEERTAAAADRSDFAVLLLSDGAPTEGTLDPAEAAGRAVAAGVPVYTVALGTDEGTVEQSDPFGNVQTIPVPPDRETLTRIAEDTGGRFYEAPSEEALREVYESLGSRLGFEEETREVTAWFAAGGLVLVLLAGGLSAVWFNRLP